MEHKQFLVKVLIPLHKVRMVRVRNRRLYVPHEFNIYTFTLLSFLLSFECFLSILCNKETKNTHGCTEP